MGRLAQRYPSKIKPLAGCFYPCSVSKCESKEVDYLNMNVMGSIPIVVVIRCSSVGRASGCRKAYSTSTIYSHLSLSEPDGFGYRFKSATPQGEWLSARTIQIRYLF